MVWEKEAICVAVIGKEVRGRSQSLALKDFCGNSYVVWVPWYFQS
jgi:hypothetical protein